MNKACKKGIKKEEFNDNNIKTFFEEIHDKCFDKNFGQMSKSEFDLLMFKFYVQECELNGVLMITHYLSH